MASSSASTAPTVSISTASPTTSRQRLTSSWPTHSLGIWNSPSSSGSTTTTRRWANYHTNDGSQHGFLYNLNTNVYTFLDDPNAATSGVSITQITGINNSSVIAGFYVDANSGLQRGFTATSVPEPGSATLAASGLALVCFVVRRRGHFRSI